MDKLEKYKKYFQNMITNGLMGHAYLFSGENPEAKKVLAEDVCKLLTAKGFKNNPDLKFIRPNDEEGKYQIHIKGIRSLKSFMSLKPYFGKHKLAVIEDADTISIPAANAMLKILEEPPLYSVLILMSSKPKLLPATILSRCETVIFPPQEDSLTGEMAEALEELRKTAKQNIAERIKYAKKIYEKESYPELVNLWLRSLRLQLGEKPNSVPVLKNLLHLSHIISQPQFNHRIALEKFLINL